MTRYNIFHIQRNSSDCNQYKYTKHIPNNPKSNVLSICVPSSFSASIFYLFTAIIFGFFSENYVPFQRKSSAFHRQSSAFSKKNRLLLQQHSSGDSLLPFTQFSAFFSDTLLYFFAVAIFNGRSGNGIFRLPATT